MHTLLIEDNISLAQTVTRYLANENIQCMLRTDGEEGYLEAINGNYDVIILDIELPTMNGIDVCRKLRSAWKSTPIIMLTSRSTQEDIITGLDYGADDYLAKPCDYRELVARIRSLGRRWNQEKWTETITIGNLAIDVIHHSVLYKNTSIELSKREYELLLYFARNRDITITKTVLLEKIWGIYDWFVDGKVVEVYIGYLRKKMPGIIVTEKWYGYHLSENL
jgi:DNA-binding response OmpR family regulator